MSDTMIGLILLVCRSSISSYSDIFPLGLGLLQSFARFYRWDTETLRLNVQFLQEKRVSTYIKDNKNY